MAGISSKAPGKLQNRYKFNSGSELQNEEFSDGTGLEFYDMISRWYDAQIGRFNQYDPIADFFLELSPNAFVANNPILMTDPYGLAGDTATRTLPDVTVGSSPRTVPQSVTMTNLHVPTVLNRGSNLVILPPSAGKLPLGDDNNGKDPKSRRLPLYPPRLSLRLRMALLLLGNLLQEVCWLQLPLMI